MIVVTQDLDTNTNTVYVASLRLDEVKGFGVCATYILRHIITTQQLASGEIVEVK